MARRNTGERMNTEIETEREESHALITVEKINALEVFTDKGMTPILEEINKKVALLVPDVTTAKGRKEIASMANKIARSKTLLDEVGKNLVADWKAKAKVVDDSRKIMRDKLDLLKEATRAPLTEWELVERERLEKYETGLKNLIELQTIPHGASVEHINQTIEALGFEKIGDDWGDLKERALAAQAYALKNAYARLEERKAYEAQQAELAKLRALELERQKLEEAKRIKDDEDRRIQEQADMKAKAQLAKAEADAAAAIQRAKEAELRAKQAEENAKRDAELAIQREKQREEQAKREAEFAAKKEADRLEVEKAKAEVEAKRKADLLQRREVRKQEAVDHLAEFVGKDSAQIVVEEIFSGSVPHVAFEK
jgi:colicin import membrane protein